MKYNLKNDHYKNFEIYKDNVLQPRSYFIPFDNEKELFKTDIRTERYNSPMVTVLSGDWDFKYYKHVSDMPCEIETDDFDFDKIKVPSVWQFTGYEKPYYLNTRYQFKPDPPKIPEDCSVGIYRKTFNIENEQGNFVLTFLGVAGSLDVFVNGKYAGYSEGSHNTSEFELNDFIFEGENELIAVVHKFSNGTYLEAQDMFRSNGIFRDVLLTKTGNNSIYDFEAKTSYTGCAYDLTILPSLKLTDPCTLTAEILFNGELFASKSIDVSADRIDKIEFKALDAEEWSAEIPNLYILVLTLSKEGRAVEIIRRPIGFKHIKINGNIFTFNGKPIKLLGVNHHDTNPKNGYVMTVEDMEQDVKLFKEYNVNCVRTSHYPPDPAFLDLCDAYGIYVVDEADIEAHGCQTELHKPGACSHNPKWQNRYWDRVYRMFERDKNHPSITMWSLGNESWGYLNQDYCYNELKKRSDIPIHYENVIRTKRFAYDVISMMYPWQSKLKKVSKGRGLPKKYYEKPFFLCEYCHAMGLGAGELETYVNYFLKSDNIMGGCIWEFADHAAYHENGKYKYTYGGDHGEEKHDGNFCVDGLFFPDRTPHSGAIQMKNCYRPVRAEKKGEGCFAFKNLNYFKKADFTVKWSSINGNNQKEDGSFELSIPPRGTQNVFLPERVCQTILFKYFCGGFEVADEQHMASAVFDNKYDNASPAPDVKKSNAKLDIKFNGGNMVFDISTGEFVSYNIKGNALISTSFKDITKGAFSSSVFRAPIDNDMYLKKVWSRLNLENERAKLKTLRHYAKENTYVIDAKYTLFSNKGKIMDYRIIYTVFGDGTILVDAKCTASKIIMYAPRFGLTLAMPRKFDNVRYFGLGSRPNLPDFHEHTALGEYSCKVDDMREKYIKPQESSMRSNVSWAEVTDNTGCGLRFSAVNMPFIFSADHFTSQQCAAAAHQEDLDLCDFTYLHLDAYQLGAGSGSCGPIPTKHYRKNSLKGLNFSFAVTPIM